MKIFSRILPLSLAMMAVPAVPALACDPAAEAKGAKACCVKGVAEGKACCVAKMKGAHAGGTQIASAKGVPASAAKAGHHGHGAGHHASAGYSNVQAKDLAAWQAKHPEAMLVDVREPDEFEGGHITGAVLVPVGTIGSWAAKQPKDRPMVLVCRSGGRSTKAAKQLEQAGFKALVNLEGGMMAWEAAGLPVAKPRASSTN
ncbi:MAG: rhodanese-like domain-containing protein [Candidatus Sericytochromatia bacterium]|nr:rhodanese-like domain-containing protein [Candidatus Sericytochromatia bacterium]